MSTPSFSPTVLILGSGLCCPPLVAYLASHSIPLTLASRTVSKAEAQVKLLPPAHQAFVRCVAYDIERDDEAAGSPQLRAIMDQASLRVAISMLPYSCHVQAAKVAISLGKHFLTTSYVSPAMQALDASARAANVLLLNECGVDPGLDHMSAKAFIDRVHSQGGKVVSFYSLCGGLPALSAKRNPLEYKLSWSPRGVLLASRNTATYLRRNERRVVEGARLYERDEGYSVEDFASHGIGQLEFYPNRDSTPYVDIYGIPECHTLLRGTYRNAGWSHFMKHLTLLGYTSTDEALYAAAKADAATEQQAFSMARLTLSLATRCAESQAAAGLPAAPTDSRNAAALQTYVAAVLGLDASDSALEKFRWLGCFDSTLTLPMATGPGLPASALDAMCGRWEALLQYEKGEKDSIVMRHTLEVEYPLSAQEMEQAAAVATSSGSASRAAFVPPAVRREQWTSTLVHEGVTREDGGVSSSMSLTVALPVAVACRALLEGRLPETCRGVVRPVEPALYNLILAEMETLGVRFVEQRQPLQLWLRSEVKKGERRTALTPGAVRELVKAGTRVTVERCVQRAIPAEQYAEAGATLAEAGSWPDAPGTAIILGLKELPESEPTILWHRHIFFAHAFKDQAGWVDVLKRFTQPSQALLSASGASASSAAGLPVCRGLLYDLEFLVNDRGQRVCAFGVQAGMVGAALGLLQYAARVGGEAFALRAPLQPWMTFDAMTSECAATLARLPEGLRTPRVMVLGALGRCGSGAVSVLKAAGLPESSLSLWDQAETKAGGPFPVIAAHDLLVNCIYLPPGAVIAPFVTLDTLVSAGASRKLLTVADVSCDASAANNPLPLYKGCTTLFEPVQRVPVGAPDAQLPPLDVISIDHLPALLPVEATASFSAALSPHLHALAPEALEQANSKDESSAVWSRAAKLFLANLQRACTQ